MVDRVAPKTFEQLRDERAAQLAVSPITSTEEDPLYNPNSLYSNYVSPDMLNTLVLRDPLVAAAALKEKGQEWLDERLLFIDPIIEQKINPYRLAPIEYDMYERHPEYMSRLDTYNSPYAKQLRKFEKEGYVSESYNPLDQRELDLRTKPIAPIGITRAKKIASLGFDPGNELDTTDIKSKDFAKNLKRVFLVG